MPSLDKLTVLTMKPVIGPQSQMNEEKACSIPSVCKREKVGTIRRF